MLRLLLKTHLNKSLGTEWIYRISQNGVYHIYPFMTKRKIKVELNTFLWILNKTKLDFEEIEDLEFRDKVIALSQGWFVITSQIDESNEEALVLHRHPTQITTMVSDLNLHKLRTWLNKI